MHLLIFLSNLNTTAIYATKSKDRYHQKFQKSVTQPITQLVNSGAFFVLQCVYHSLLCVEM